MEGKILVATWGYTMTLQKFVKVFKQTPKTLKVVELVKKSIPMKNPAGFQNLVEPIEEVHYEDSNAKTYILYKCTLRKNCWFSNKDGFRLNFTEWNGKPMLEDHND
jgi:hypothetical protein